MNGLILVLSLICGAASVGAVVCAVLILRLLLILRPPKTQMPPTTKDTINTIAIISINHQTLIFKFIHTNQNYFLL